MNISAASKAAGLPVKTVRYYADIGLVPAAERTDSGYRIYNGAEVRSLVFVRRAREFGFSVDECRELLGLYEDQHRASSDVKRMAERRLKEIARKQRELESLRKELAELVDACRGDDGRNAPLSRAWKAGGTDPVRFGRSPSDPPTHAVTTCRRAGCVRTLRVGLRLAAGPAERFYTAIALRSCFCP